MTWDDGLSSNQRTIASHWGSSALVLAGPGTGKTRTLIQRIAYLLQERQIPSDQIIALTFTRAAARELQERLIQHLGVDQNDVPLVCTLHSFALRTLLKHHEESGIVQPLCVADDYEEQYVLFPEIGQMINRSVSDVEQALKAFEATWNTLNEDCEAWSTIEFKRDFERALRELSRFYGFTLRAEMVYQFLQLLNANPILIEEMGVKHLLVDEYQDLNYCDQQVISIYEQQGTHLFVVGDDDQSIYEFRHAYPQGIRELANTYVGNGLYALDTCHRCPKSIIRSASSLVVWNTDRVNKALTPVPDAIDGETFAIQFRGYAEEAKGIATICKLYVDARMVEPRDIAILLSRRSLAEPIVGCLQHAGLPVTTLVPIWPFGGRDNNDQSGRQAYCLLRLLANVNDALALRTWLGLQPGIGPQTLHDVKSLCMDRDLTLWNGLQLIHQQPNLISRGSIVKRSVERLTVEIERLHAASSLGSLLDILVGPIDGASSTGGNATRQFLNRLIEQDSITTLDETVSALQTYDVNAETELAADAVRVMTMHKAKGLSAEVVIIPALEQELIPGQYSESMARRLMYVAMTRARRTLIMTHAYTRTGSQSHLGNAAGKWQRRRSQFMNEIGAKSRNGDTFVSELQVKLLCSPPLAHAKIDTSVLRELIQSAFSDEELEIFCYDHFQDVLNQFGSGMSKTVKIHRLVLCQSLNVG